MGEKNRKLEMLKQLSPTANFVLRYADRSNDTRTAPCACLGCGKLLDGASALQEGQQPTEGCISICSSCGHLQAFDKDLKFRPLTDEEIVDIAGQPEVVAVNNVRGKLREFWNRDDYESAYEFIVSNIRKDIRKARK